MIDSKYYKPPIILFYPDSPYWFIFKYDDLKEIIKKKETLELVKQDTKEKYIISWDTLEKILDYFDTKACDPMFYKLFPKLEDWQHFGNGSHLAAPSPCIVAYDLLNEEMKREVDLAINKAYLNEDYEAVIKLATWLILQELSHTVENQNKHRISKLYENIIKAYLNYSKQFPLKAAQMQAAKIAAYMLEQLKARDKENAVKIEKQLEIESVKLSHHDDREDGIKKSFFHF